MKRIRFNRHYPLIILGFLIILTNSCKKDDDTIPTTVTDIDENVYHTLIIGKQVWMVENLKVTRYNNGTAIPLVTDNTAWTDLRTPGYCWYNNDEATNKETYGAFYNWYTVETGKLAPKGWHVPTDIDWSNLENYLIANGYNFDNTTDNDGDRLTFNKIAKSMAATTNWYPSTQVGSVGNSDYPDKRNETGFTAFPGGYRGDGLFLGIESRGYWWSATENSEQSAWFRCLHTSYSDVYRDDAAMNIGLSVRCVMD